MNNFNMASPEKDCINFTAGKTEVRTDVVKKLNDKVVMRIRSDIVQRPPGYKPSEVHVQTANDIQEISMQAACIQEWMMPQGDCKSNVVSILDGANGYKTFIADSGCEWVADFLYYEHWQPGSRVFIETGCGTGKNTYVEMLHREKRYFQILILANRRANKEQIMSRLNIKDGKLFQGAVVRTYQSLELDTDLTSEDLDGFDLIICDEAHYFICDSMFNSRTNVCLNRILGTKRAIVIFMSATLTETKEKVMDRLRKYHSMADLIRTCSYYKMIRSKQNIDSVSCITEYEAINAMKASQDKWLIFVDSKEMGYSWKEKLGNKAVFITADSSINDKIAKQEYETICKKERFEHQILIATSVLDNGVNLKDYNLRNVLIASNDRIEMIQMLGRKRCIDSSDSFKLYLLHYGHSEILQQLALTRLEMEKWRSVRTFLQAECFPPLSYSLNSPNGDELRQMVYMDEKQKKFIFNYLGYQGMRVKEKNLIELSETSDIFLKKCQWIFEGLPMPTVEADTAAAMAKLAEAIMAKVKDHIGNTYSIKEEKMMTFMSDFSHAYKELYGLDKEDNQRPDRILSVSKIRKACAKQQIPLLLTKETVNRKTLYRIE